MCPRCGASVPETWQICSSCGSELSPIMHKGGVESYPPQLCLRCGEPMKALGTLRLHEGTRAWPFLLAELGELLVNRESFEAFSCIGCGKVELFLPKSPRGQP